VNLGDIVQRKKVSLESLSSRIFAIDAYNALYQFLSIIRGEAGEPLRDHEGRVTSHLSGIFYRTVNLLSLNIKPVYIFDGPPSKLKSTEITRRHKIKEKAEIKLTEALSKGKFKEAKKYAQATSVLRNYMIEDTKTLLQLLGIPWIDAPSEGEATAAHLTNIGLATDAVSQDYDSILFGAKRLLRNVTISGKRKLPNRPIYIILSPEELTLQNVLSNLQLSREQLVDVGILLGTDFNPGGFKGIGPAKAIKYIKSYRRLEKIPDIKQALKEINYESIRDIFLNPKVISPPPFSWNDIDEDGLLNFLSKDRDFSEERIRSSIIKLTESKKKISNSLEKWIN